MILWIICFNLLLQLGDPILLIVLIQDALAVNSSLEIYHGLFVMHYDYLFGQVIQYY